MENNEQKSSTKTQNNAEVSRERSNAEGINAEESNTYGSSAEGSNVQVNISDKIPGNDNIEDKITFSEITIAGAITQLHYFHCLDESVSLCLVSSNDSSLYADACSDHRYSCFPTSFLQRSDAYASWLQLGNQVADLAAEE